MSDTGRRISGATNTLVCAPSMSGDGGGGPLCTDLLQRGETNPTVLWVTYARSAAACVKSYSGDGADLTVVAVGDAGADDESGLDGVTVETVSTPSDLTGLGITVSQILSRAENVVVCFDSVTALLQYVEVVTVYDFLHAITGQLYAADARAHFHIDRSAHDRQTVDALASLFDEIIDCRDGEHSVRSRVLLQE